MSIKVLRDQRQATETIDGFSATVPYNVWDVANETEALEHPGIPRVGDTHPDRRSAVVLSVTARPAQGGNGVFQVLVQYGVPEASQSFQPTQPGATGLIELGAASTVLSTNRDINGNAIKVEHTFVEQLAVGTVDRRREVQGSEVEFEAAQPLLIQRRQETVAPIAKSREFSNTINRYRIWGFERETLLCLPITAVSNDGGASYTVTYQFQAADTWQAEARFRDRTTGRPPVDLVEGDGIVLVDVYRKTDFGKLGLAFPGFF